MQDHSSADILIQEVQEKLHDSDDKTKRHCRWMIKTVVNDFKPNKPSPSLWTKIGNCARELLPFQCDEATEELAIFVIVNDIIDPMDMYRFLIAEEKTEFFHIVHLEDKVREDLKSVGALSQEVYSIFLFSEHVKFES
jgi:hypothetical protein